MGFLSGITSFVKEHSDVIHGVLDLAGFIPGVGAVADLVNAAVYVVEGDYVNAALSVVSAVPGIGDTVALAKKSTKVIKGGVKAMKNMKALTKAKNMKGLFGLLRGKAQTGARKLAGKFTDMKALYRDLKNGNKKLCLFGKCFTGDTLVYAKQGYVPIKDIREGDEIYSRNAETGETGFKEVEEVFRTGAHTIYRVELDGKEEVKTTAYHPIYVEKKGWVNAINLQEGDPVQTMEGTACITRIGKERYEEPVPVYNFHVKDWMSYFVSEMQIFVHNKIKVHSKGDVDSKLRLSDKVRKLKQDGDYRQALDIHYEDLIGKKVGGKSQVIQGREYDIVTDSKLIQAKRSYSAIDRPDNFLKGKTRRQIKETARVAKELGLKPEYWFKYGVHPKVRAYIESKGIKIIIGLGE